MSPPRTLTEAKNLMGWRHPWHAHFRTIRNGVEWPYNPEKPPVYAVNCAPDKCEAPGCPRTASGFPAASPSGTDTADA